MKKKTFTSERVSKGVMVGLSRAVKKKSPPPSGEGMGMRNAPPFPENGDERRGETEENHARIPFASKQRSARKLLPRPVVSGSHGSPFSRWRRRIPLNF